MSIKQSIAPIHMHSVGSNSIVNIVLPLVILGAFDKEAVLYLTPYCVSLTFSIRRPKLWPI